MPNAMPTPHLRRRKTKKRNRKKRKSSQKKSKSPKYRKKSSCTSKYTIVKGEGGE